MLRKNYNEPDRSARRTSRFWAATLLMAVVVALIVLRLDFWNKGTVRPMLFGFLPVGLWWQALISFLAAVMMWLMVRLAWPTHLEELERGSASTKNPLHADSRPETK